MTTMTGSELFNELQAIHTTLAAKATPYTEEYIWELLEGKQGTTWDFGSHGIVVFVNDVLSLDGKVLVGCIYSKWHGGLVWEFSIESSLAGTIVRQTPRGFDCGSDVLITPAGEILKAGIEPGSGRGGRATLDPKNRLPVDETDNRLQEILIGLRSYAT